LDGISCDRCGKSLLIDEEVRYQVKIVVQAAYDPMEISTQDLQGKGPDSWKNLIKSLENLSAEEAQDQVYREIRFDLCPPCQKIYLASPIPGTDVSGSSSSSGSGIST
jgi:hypothetical protein